MTREKAERRAAEIARKWVRKLGLGFHPDTPAEEYVNTETGRASLSSGERREYEADMEALLNLPLPDPYAAVLAAAGV